MVFAQLLLETTQTATYTYDIVHHFTMAYTNPFIIDEVGTIWISIPLMIGLSTYMHNCVGFNPQLTKAAPRCTI